MGVMLVTKFGCTLGTTDVLFFVEYIQIVQTIT